MNMHKNARLTPYSRALMVRRIETEGRRVREVAREFGVSERAVYKWLARKTAATAGTVPLWGAGRKFRDHRKWRACADRP